MSLAGHQKIVKTHENIHKASGLNKTKGLLSHGNVSCVTGTAKNHTLEISYDYSDICLNPQAEMFNP